MHCLLGTGTEVRLPGTPGKTIHIREIDGDASAVRFRRGIPPAVGSRLHEKRCTRWCAGIARDDPNKSIDAARRRPQSPAQPRRTPGCIDQVARMHVSSASAGAPVMAT